MKFMPLLLLLGVVTFEALGTTPNIGVESADTVLEKEERDALLKSPFETRLAFLQERRTQIMATPPPDPEREPFATRVVSFDDLKAIEWSVLFSLREFPEKADVALQELTEWLPFRWTIESDGLRGGRDRALTPVPGAFNSYGDKGRAKLIEVFDKSPNEGVRRLAFQKLSQWGRSQGHVEPWLQELWDRTANVDELLEPVMTVIFDRAAAKEGLPPFRETIKKQAAERDAKLMAQAKTASYEQESARSSSTEQPSSKEIGSKPPVRSNEPASPTPWSVVAVLIVAAAGLLWLLVKKRK